MGLSTNVFFSFVGAEVLQHAQTYYLNVRATDNAGHSVVASSDGVIIDITPALHGLVEHGLHATVARQYSRFTNVALMRWTGVVDPESGVLLYEYGLGETTQLTEDGQPDLVPFVPIGLGDQAAVADVTLVHTHVYYGFVRVLNGVGLRSVSTSTGFMVDVTRPDCTLRDGSREGADLEFSTTGIPRGYVQCVDLESGVPTIDWGIGTVRGWDDTQPFITAPATSQAIPAYQDNLYDIPAHLKSPYRIMDSELVSFTPLLDGVRYYIVAVARNGAGAGVFLTSNGQVHDTSPPETLFLRDVVTPGGDRDVAWSTDLTSWGAVFDIRDPHTGVANITIDLVTGSGASAVVLDSVQTSVNATRVFRSLATDLVVGTRVWVRATAANKAGLVARLESDGFIPDNTPPVFTALPTDGLVAGVDSDHHISPGSLAACWTAADPDTQISHYLIAVGNLSDASAGMVPMERWTKVPASASEESGIRLGARYVAGVTCAYAPAGRISQGVQRRVLVTAVNAGGLNTTAVTDGVIVDWTAPSVQHLAFGTDALATNFSTQTSRTEVTLSWSRITEEESPLTSVQIGLGTIPGLDNMVPRQAVGGDPDTSARAGGTVTLSGLTLMDGVSYYATLWMTNQVGLVTAHSSAALLVDGSAPDFLELTFMPFMVDYILPNSFVDQPSYPGAVSDVSLIVPLTSFTERHSGIATLTVSVYTSMGDPAEAAGVASGDLLPGAYAHGNITAADVEVDISEGYYTTVIRDVTVRNNTFVWAVVNVTNRLGLRTSRASRAIVINTGGLVAGFVNDGSRGASSPALDEDYVPSAASYSARWDGFHDPRSEIRYSVCLGSQRGQCDIRDFENVGLEQHFDVLQDFAVEPGTLVFATVQGRTELGLTANASSDGIVLGSKPPVVRDVTFVGSSPLADEPYDPATGAHYVIASPVRIEWAASDEQGIDRCRVVVRGSMDDSVEPLFDITTNDGSERSVQYTDAVMDEGQVMYATVTCINIRNVTTVTEANAWAVVETTPVSPGVVVDGSAATGVDMAFTADHTSASAHWFHFVDAESHVRGVVACLGNMVSPCGEARFESHGDSSAKAAGLNLTHGGEYLWTVTVTSGAGINTTVVSDGFTVDTHAPSAATAFVVDGLHTNADADADVNAPHDTTTSVDGTSYEVAWGGFADAVSGIAGYTVMLGWSPGAHDVASAVELDASAREYAFTGLASVLAGGGHVYATVRCEDNVGWSSELTSSGVLIDPTPPIAPVADDAIMEGHNTTAVTSDVDIQSVTSYHLAWHAFVDAETGIDRYEVQVVDTTGITPVVVLPWSSVGNATSFSHRTLPLLHAHTYVGHVRAFNGAGGYTDIHSDGVALDTTDPVPGEVLDGSVRADGDLDVTPTVGIVAAHWSGFDDQESALSHYEWCVGTSPGKDDIVACHDVGTAHHGIAYVNDPLKVSVDVAALLAPAFGTTVADAAAASGGTLPDGSLSSAVLATINPSTGRMPAYFSTVTYVSETGGRAAAYSNGVSVDVLPPAVEVVVDTASVDTLPTGVQTSTSTLHAAWSGVTDFQTTVSSLKLSVGTTPGGSDVVASKVVNPLDTSHALYNLQLTDGVTYYTTVSAVDAAGNVGGATSAGVKVDSTPPVFDFLRDYDGSGANPGRFRAVSFNTVVTLEWGAHDDESGVARYDVRVCPTLLPQPDAEAVAEGDTLDETTPCMLDWTDVATRTRVELNSPPFTPGVSYRAEVRATSGSGVSSLEVSEGFTIDTSAPTAGVVHAVAGSAAADVLARDVEVQLPEVELVGTWSSIGVQWTGWQDDESGMASYSVCVGSTPRGDDIVACHNVGRVYTAVVDVSAAPVPSSGSVFLSVIGRSSAGLTSVAVSNAVEVDLTPAMDGTVQDGTSGRDADFSTHSAFVCAVAEGFTDVDTGVVSYEMCVGSSPGACDVSPYAPAIVSLSSSTVDAEASPLNTTDTTEEDDDDDEPTSVQSQRPFEQLCVHGMAFTHGQLVYVSVRAINGAGIASAGASSNGVTIVLEDPPVGAVSAVELNADYAIEAGAAEASLYGQRRAVGAVWSGFAAGHPAPAASFAVAVCGAVAGCQNADNPLSFFADIGATTQITLGAQVLTDGEEYAFHVRVTDAAGRTATAVGNSFRIDTTPPVLGVVDVLSIGALHRDLNPSSVRFSDDALSDTAVVLLQGLAAREREAHARMWHGGYAPLHVAWHSFGDPESGLASFRVCVGANVTHFGVVADCKTLPATARYAHFRSTDIDQEFVATALEAAIKAADNVNSADANAEAEVDIETGLIPLINATVEVQSVASVVVRVEACNMVGVCTPGLSRVVGVDLTPPVSGYISGMLSADGTTEPASVSNRFAWRAEWDEWADTESGVAFYTVSIVDADTGDVALGPVNMDTLLSFETANVELLHGHAYVTEVTAYNYAGLNATARSEPTSVDVTPPEGGFVYDIFDMDTDEEVDAVDEDGEDVGQGILPSNDGDDADYGDADVGAIEARWGDWHDPQSPGPLTYEWAIMALDPRRSNPVGAAKPGQLLSAAVTKYIQAKGGDLYLPPRKYGTGAASQMHEVDGGLMFTDWLATNETSAYRVDLDIVTGVTYVVLLRVTNTAGLSTVASSDGIVFDAADPCLGQPFAGTTPDEHAAYLTNPTEISATWRGVVDPLNQQSVPFECLTQAASNANPEHLSTSGSATVTDGDTDAEQNRGTLAINGTAGSASNAVSVDVPVGVVPLGHMEWRLRKMVPSTDPIQSLANASVIAAAAEAAGFDEDVVPINATTSELYTRNDTLSEDPADYVDDTPVEDVNVNATSVVVTDFAQVGPATLSPWSGCCSSYSELNPLVMTPEWDWRPVHTRHGFGYSLAMSHDGRYAVVGGWDGATIFDVHHPKASQHRVSAAAIHTAASVGTPAGAAGMAVRVAASHYYVVYTSDAMALYTLPVAANVITGDDEVAPELVTAMPATASMLASSSFTPVKFGTAAAAHQNLVAIALNGVAGSSSARAVAVLRVAGDASVGVVGVHHSTVASFADAMSLSVATSGAVMLTVTSPPTCRNQGTTDADNYATDCGAGFVSPLPQTFGDSVATLLVVGDSSLTVANASALALSHGDGASIGTATASAGNLLAVGDPTALGGRGRLSIHAVDSAEAPRLCSVAGVVPSGGLGYALAVVSADVEGHVATSGPAARNRGTFLVVAGSPAANLVTIVRVNMTAWSVGVRQQAAVCSTVAVFRQEFQDTGIPPLFGAGTSVTIAGSVVLFSSPHSRTWRDHTSPGETATSTGRLFGATFCWAGDVRHAVMPLESNLPTVCKPCGGTGDERWSAGGTSRTCETCAADSVCRPADEYLFSAVNSSAAVELGESYEIDIKAVSRSGRTNTQATRRFTMDWTPPETGLVSDLFLGNQTQECNGCVDVDVMTNATYLSASWCCGWQDLQSGLASYSVAFGTSPDDMDIMDWTPVGMNTTYTLWGVDLVTAQRYYACVVASNQAGLFSSPVCSDGFVYDSTPPVMLEVLDGLTSGVDVDQQSYANMAFATYLAQDNETAVVDYVFSLGFSPGDDSVFPPKTAANSTFNGAIRNFAREAVAGDTLYANVFAINEVGLVSATMSSNGVVIGKSELAVDKDQGGVMAMDVMDAEPEDSPDVDPPVTVATASVPKGAVTTGVKLKGGKVTENDIANGDAVNVTQVAPRNNLRFGDYSFTMKAADNAGSTIEGFVFEKPVRFTFRYDVAASLKGEAAEESWQPSLMLYDISSGTWINAANSCPPELRYSNVNHKTREFTVDVCHLTQFGVFYQRRPEGEIVPHASHPILNSSLGSAVPRMLASMTAQGAALVSADQINSGLNVQVVRLVHATTASGSAIVRPSAPLTFATQGVRDPDGTIESAVWSAIPLWTGAVAPAPTAQSQAGATLDDATKGLVALQLVLTDNQDATHDDTHFVWLDTPPTAVLGLYNAAVPFNVSAVRPVGGVWPRIVMHVEPPPAGQAGASSSVSLDGRASHDPDGSSLSPHWFLVPGSVKQRYSRPASDLPTVGPTAGNAFVGVVGGIKPATELTVALQVTTLDEGSATDRATVQIVVNARPQAVVTVPQRVFLNSTTVAGSFTATSAASQDLDGAIVSRTWAVSQPPPSDLQQSRSPMVVTPSAGDTQTSLIVSNIFTAGVFGLQLTLTDSDGGVTTVSTSVQVEYCGDSPPDSDGDGTPDCYDLCYNDPDKLAPGVCGCGVVEDVVDSDGDGVVNCLDECPTVASKTEAGACGCAQPDVDVDGDGAMACHDDCPTDANKVEAGVCGCGVSDADTDGDGTPNCHDQCPLDAIKVTAGVCGCATLDTDSDSDSTPDCVDRCPSDPNKTAPGSCGCGVSDVDTDGDGVFDCLTCQGAEAGSCGCTPNQPDSDGDGTVDCNDGCPADSAKTAPGECGCGVADVDTDNDGTADCATNECAQCPLATRGPCRHANDGTCLQYLPFAPGVCPTGTTPCVRVPTPVAADATCTNCIGGVRGRCKAMSTSVCYALQPSGACPAGTVACGAVNFTTAVASGLLPPSAGAGVGLFSIQLRGALTSDDIDGAATAVLMNTLIRILGVSDSNVQLVFLSNTQRSAGASAADDGIVVGFWVIVPPTSDTATLARRLAEAVSTGELVGGLQADGLPSVSSASSLRGEFTSASTDTPQPQPPVDDGWSTTTIILVAVACVLGVTALATAAVVLRRMRSQREDRVQAVTPSLATTQQVKGLKFARPSSPSDTLPVPSDDTPPLQPKPSWTVNRQAPEAAQAAMLPPKVTMDQTRVKRASVVSAEDLPPVHRTSRRSTASGLPSPAGVSPALFVDGATMGMPPAPQPAGPTPPGSMAGELTYELISLAGSDLASGAQSSAQSAAVPGAQSNFAVIPGGQSPPTAAIDQSPRTDQDDQDDEDAPAPPTQELDFVNALVADAGVGMDSNGSLDL